MNYEEFCIWVKDRLNEQQNKDVRIEMQSVRKNNGVMQEGLLFIQEGSNVAPTIYLKEFYCMYENGMDPETVLKRLQVVYEINKAQTNLDFSFFEDFSQVQDRIVYKVINRKNNKALLEEIPWVPLLDLAVVFYCILPEHIFSNGTVLVNHSHCRAWNIDEKKLFSIAEENTPRLCPPILLDMKKMLQIYESMEEGETDGSALEELWKPVSLENLEFSDKKEEHMFVLTNEKRNQGAVAAFYNGVLKSLSDKFESDLYIMPSSIHECIIISAEEDSREELEGLVYKVNHSRVAEEERLSNHVYRYVREKDQVV